MNFNSRYFNRVQDETKSDTQMKPNIHSTCMQHPLSARCACLLSERPKRPKLLHAQTLQQTDGTEENWTTELTWKKHLRLITKKCHSFRGNNPFLRINITKKNASVSGGQCTEISQRSRGTITMQRLE